MVDFDYIATTAVMHFAKRSALSNLPYVSGHLAYYIIPM